MEELLLDLKELEELENGVRCLLNENNEATVAIECLIIKLGIQKIKAGISAKAGESSTMQCLYIGEKILESQGETLHINNLTHRD